MPRCGSVEMKPGCCLKYVASAVHAFSSRSTSSGLTLNLLIRILDPHSLPFEQRASRFRPFRLALSWSQIILLKESYINMTLRYSMLLVVEQANGRTETSLSLWPCSWSWGSQNVIVSASMGPSSAYTVEGTESFVYRRGEDGINGSPFQMVSPNQVPWTRIIGNTY